MSSENKTEQATPRRRQKAREKGQVARSRELSAALAFAGALGASAWVGRSLPEWFAEMMNSLQTSGRADQLTLAPLYYCGFHAARASAVPLLAAFTGAAIGTVIQGGFIFGPSLLAPTGSRMNPAQRVQQMFSVTTLASMSKSLVLAAAVAAIGWDVIAKHFDSLTYLMAGSRSRTAAVVASCAFEFCWKSAIALAAWGALDYWLVRNKFERDLRMTKQEIREEMKESEGNPQMKTRIRRLQRQMRRRKMLQDVPRATVVVTNPTHFAIALEYRPDMAAPVVLAKGRDRLAQKIKQMAIWNGIPIAENVPLAHALYRTTEVGDAIPSKLYTAVAEILAALYRARAAAARGGAR